MLEQGKPCWFKDFSLPSETSKDPLQCVQAAKALLCLQLFSSFGAQSSAAEDTAQCRYDCGGARCFSRTGTGATAHGREGPQAGQPSRVTLLLELLPATGWKNLHLNTSASLSKEAEPGKLKSLLRLSGFKLSAVTQSSAGTDAISTPLLSNLWFLHTSKEPELSQGRAPRTLQCLFYPTFPFPQGPAPGDSSEISEELSKNAMSELRQHQCCCCKCRNIGESNPSTEF